MAEFKLHELYCEGLDGDYSEVAGFFCEGHINKKEFFDEIFDRYGKFTNETGLLQEISCLVNEKWNLISINKKWKLISIDDIKHKYCKWFKEDESELNYPYLLVESNRPCKGYKPMTILDLV